MHVSTRFIELEIHHRWNLFSCHVTIFPYVISYLISLKPRETYIKNDLIRHWEGIALITEHHWKYMLSYWLLNIYQTRIPLVQHNSWHKSSYMINKGLHSILKHKCDYTFSLAVRIPSPTIKTGEKYTSQRFNIYMHTYNAAASAMAMQQELIEGMVSH